MVHDGRVRELDRLGNTAADEAADLVVGGFVLLLLMRVVICLGFVVAGTLLFLTFIGFSWPFLVQWSIMMVGDGTAPDPMVWSAGALPKRRWLVHPDRDRATWYLGLGLGQCA